MKCFFCEEEIDDDEKFIDGKSLHLFWKSPQGEYQQINAICWNCLERNAEWYDKIGEEIDKRMED